MGPGWRSIFPRARAPRISKRAPRCRYMALRLDASTGAVGSIASTPASSSASRPPRMDFSQPLGKVSYHVPCHGRVQNIGRKTEEMLKMVP